MLPRFFALVILLPTLVTQGTGVAWAKHLAAIFDGAEERFVQPPEEWFAQTQQALSKEVDRIGLALDSHGGEDSRYWKNHLRWPLLKKNLGPPETVDLDALALVRRWMYSDRPGLEDVFFARLRRLMDDYLDAAVTTAQKDLPAQFKGQVVLARQQCQLLEESPTDVHAAALGRTLGWFERTRQLSDEVAGVRLRASFPNAQVLVTHSLIARVLAGLVGDIQQTIHITDQVQPPPTGRVLVPRTLNVRGTARTWGVVSHEMVHNSERAELSLVYRGQVESHCRVDAGRVQLHLETKGPVVADTPIYLSLDGLSRGETSVTPRVGTRLVGVTAGSELLRRIAARRASQPEAESAMRSRSRAKTVSMLQEEMQEGVDSAIAKIRAEMRTTTDALAGFSEVLAPIVREGAAPQLLGTQSSGHGMELNVLEGRREQWGAPAPCPFPVQSGGVIARVHVSFFNNLAETIMAGKTFPDTYFMNYGRILRAELPLPLMVHSRSQRWALIAADERPLVLRIPAPNRFEFTLRTQGIEFDRETILTPATAQVSYELVQNDFDEYRLERVESLQLHSELDSEHQAFLHSKLSAFFGPVLDGGGMAIPDGGALGRVAALEVPTVLVDRDWIVLQITGLEGLFLQR